jgi:hypothetical protein
MDKMNNFDRTYFNFSFKFSLHCKIIDKVTKTCKDINTKFENSRVLNVIEGLHIRNILEFVF